ncbi:MAG: cation:H+ antiporter [Gammaproteobacteria bacterium]|jgi:cation:H+ antiporter
MFLYCFEIIAGLILLIFGADRFVSGAVSISRILGISPLIIGITIVGMATSAPEILVGSVAAIEGKTGIAVGNAIGSNIANISLVLGGAAFFLPFVATSKTLGREYLVMMGALLLGLIVMIDLNLSRLDAFILLSGLIAFIFWSIYMAKQSRAPDPLIIETEHQTPKTYSKIKSIVMLILGLITLLLGAEILVTGAINVAKAFGISDVVIGLTIIAVGTSLPELAASISSIIKNEADIAIGNIIGSNIFNIFAVLSIPVLIHPDSFVSEVLTRDVSIMFILSFILGWIIFKRKKFDRPAGLILLSIFLGYQSWLFTHSTGV